MQVLTESRLPVRGKQMRIQMFRSDSGEEVVALARGGLSAFSNPIVRIHSQCLTGDVLGSQRCDCGPQLQFSLDRMARARSGLLLYCSTHEGRGIGLEGKLKAYALQDNGLDTVEANEALGFPVDDRDYSLSVKVLQYFGLSQIRLLTNNPIKVAAVESSGITVIRVPLPLFCNPHNRRYLTAKSEKMGHLYTV